MVVEGAVLALLPEVVGIETPEHGRGEETGSHGQGRVSAAHGKQEDGRDDSDRPPLEDERRARMALDHDLNELEMLGKIVSFGFHVEGARRQRGRREK